MIDGVTRRGSSPVFVGRHAELDRLLEAYDRAAARQPSLVLVAGEAGVGKSRLMSEVTTRIAALGGWSATGGCLDLGEGGLPYAPFVEALRAAVRQLDPVRRTDFAGSYPPVLARLMPELAPARSSDESGRMDDPFSRLARLFDAVIDVLGKLSADRPLAIVLEDVHWADGSTRDLIRFLARNLRSERLMVVATYRSDDLHRRHPLMPLLTELERGERVERLELRPFDRAELGQQLAAIIGEAPSAGLLDALLARSDGIPFYAEELIAAGDDAKAIPSSMRDILERRLATLSSGSLGVVRAAAVIGGRFAQDRLEAVAALDEEALIDALREAIDARVLVPEENVDRPVYTFRHALLREAAYDELMPAERVRLHARLADHLEGQVGIAAVEDPSVVADFAAHAYLAHDQPRALLGSVRAMDAAIEAVAYREALGHAERAIELWPRVPDGEALVGLAHADLLEMAARIAGEAGEPARSIALGLAALSVVERDGDPEQLGRLLDALYLAAFESWDTDVAADVARRASVLLPSLAPNRTRAQLLLVVGTDHWTNGRIRASLSLFEESMAIAQANEDRRGWTIAASEAAHALADLGRGGRAEQLAEAALAEHSGFDGNAWGFWAVVDRASALWFAGRFDRADQIGREALAATVRYGVTDRHSPWLAMLDPVFELGRIDELDNKIRRAEGSILAAHPMLNLWAMKAKVHLIRGEIEQARRTLPEAPKQDSEVGLAWWLESEVVVARAEGRFDKVRAAAQHAMAIADRGEAIAPLWLTLFSAIGAATDHAIAARRRRRSEEVVETVTIATGWVDRLIELTDEARADGGAGAFCEAMLATAKAERTRLDGSPEPNAWAAALDHWQSIGQRYQTIYSRLRLAEAILDASGDRDVAADTLRTARGDAVEMGATALGEEIESVGRRGRIELDPGVDQGFGEPFAEGDARITGRERDVLQLVAEGHTNREIGDRLFISEKTVSVHVSNAMAKLGALSRYEAAAAAERQGLL